MYCDVTLHCLAVPAKPHAGAAAARGMPRGALPDTSGSAILGPRATVGTAMRIHEFMLSIEGVRRKLRRIAAVLRDPAATENERANAAALKRRLEQRLKEAGVPKGDWTDAAFRLGRALTEIKKSAPPVAPAGDWTDGAFRLGSALRRGYRKLRTPGADGGGRTPK